MHRRTIHHVLLAVAVLHGTCQAQHKAFPDGLYFGARLSVESDGPFTTNRERPLASYPFRCGVGPQLLYVKNLTGGLGWGVETGGWYFWNKDADTDALGRAFNRRAMVLPLLANAHVALIRKPRLGLFLQASGGLAYTQTIHRYEGRSMVEQDTHGLYGVTAVLFIGLFKVKMTKDPYAGHHFGTSYFDVRGHTVRSVFVPMLLR